MRRRIIKQGHNTLTVTLPSTWAKKFEVKPASDVEITEQGKELIITPTGSSKSFRTEIDITNLSTRLSWRLISSAYRAGYEEIKVTFGSNGSNNLYTAFTYDTLAFRKEKDLSQIEEIQALVNRFIGVEIIDQRSHYCIIKELGETSLKEFDNALRRIFLLLQIMSEKAQEAASGEHQGLKEIHIIDTNLDRFEDYCLRVLNRNGYSEFKKTQTMYTLIFLLEMVGDEFKKLALHFLKLKKVSKHFEEFLAHIDKMLRAYYKLHYQFSAKDVEKIYKMTAEAEKLFSRIIKNLSREEIELAHHLKKIERFISSLTELRIDLEYI